MTTERTPRARAAGRVVDVNVINGEDVIMPGTGGLPEPAQMEDEAEEEEATAPIIPEWMIAGIVEGSFKMAAASRGDHWLIDDDQRDSIAEPLSGELDDLVREIPFLHDASGSISERRLRLVASLGGTIGIRLIKDYNLARQRAKDEATAKSRAGNGDRAPRPIRADMARVDPPPPSPAYVPGDVDLQPAPPDSLGDSGLYRGGETFADQLAARIPPTA